MRQATVQRCWRRGFGGAAVVLMVVAFGHTEAQAQQQKPNILVIILPQAGMFNGMRSRLSPGA